MEQSIGVFSTDQAVCCGKHSGICSSVCKLSVDAFCAAHCMIDIFAEVFTADYLI